MVQIYTIEMNPSSENNAFNAAQYPIVLKNKLNQKEFLDLMTNCNMIFKPYYEQALRHREKLQRRMPSCCFPFRMNSMMTETIQLQQKLEKCIRNCQHFIQKFTIDKNLYERDLSIMLKRQQFIERYDRRITHRYVLEFQILTENPTVKLEKETRKQLQYNALEERSPKK